MYFFLIDFLISSITSSSEPYVYQYSADGCSVESVGRGSTNLSFALTFSPSLSFEKNSSFLEFLSWLADVARGLYSATEMLTFGLFLPEDFGEGFLFGSWVTPDESTEFRF